MRDGRKSESSLDNPSFRETLANFYYDLVPLVSLNIIWFLLTLPVLTAIPAAAGLYYATNQLGHQNNADWKTFFEGFRMYFKVSWYWGLLNIVVFLILGANIFYYGQYETQGYIILRGISIGIAILWGVTQLFSFPFLLEQEEPKVLLAVRNSLMLFAASPVQVMGVAILVGLILIVSTFFAFPAWFFITVSLCTYISNKVVIDSVQKFKESVSPKSQS